MNDSPLTCINDRLIDYFVVVGIDKGLQPVYPSAFTDGEDPLPAITADLRFTPSTLSRYPAEDHVEAPLPADITVLCFPNDVKLQQLASIVDIPAPRFYTTVATNSNGDRSYCHALIFHEQLSDTSKSTLESAELERLEASKLQLFAPKALCLISKWSVPAFRVILNGIYEAARVEAPTPLEHIIVNAVSEVPLPPAGKVFVSYAIGDYTVKIARPPKNDRISPINLPFQPVFDALLPADIVEIVRSLLFDNSVLFVSSQYSLITAACEVITALLYPFKWRGIYIPLLPRRDNASWLQLPTPFVAGIDADEFIAIKDDVPTRLIVAHLDERWIRMPESLYGVPFPPKIAFALLSDVESCMSVLRRDGGCEMMWKRLDSLEIPLEYVGVEATVPALYATDYIHSCNASHLKANEVWYAIRAAFFRAFLHLFEGYRDFLVTPSLENNGNGSFNVARYTARMPDAQAAFYKELACCLTFAKFVEDHFEQNTVRALDVLFFQECRELLKPSSKSRTVGFVCSREHDYNSGTLAVSPIDLTAWKDLPRRTSFPVLNSLLFRTPTPIPTYVDESTAAVERQSFRRGVISILRGVDGEGRLSAGFSKDVESDLRKATPEKMAYVMWFLLFIASLDTVRAFIGQRACEEFDEAEAAWYPAPELVKDHRVLKKSPTTILNKLKLRKPIDDTRGTLSPGSCIRYEDDDDDEGGVRRRRESNSALLREREITRKKRREDTVHATCQFYLEKMLERAVALKDEMKQLKKLNPGEVVYRCLLEACNRLNSYGRVHQLLQEMHDAGLKVDTSTYGSLLANIVGPHRRVASMFAMSPAKGHKTTTTPRSDSGLSSPPGFSVSRNASSDSGFRASSSDSGFRSPLSPAADSAGTSKHNITIISNKMAKTAAKALSAKPVTSPAMTDATSSVVPIPCFTVTESNLWFRVGREDAGNITHVAVTVTLAQRFGGLCINTHQTCPLCSSLMLDDDVERGWSGDIEDYRTHHVGCTADASKNKRKGLFSRRTSTPKADGGDDDDAAAHFVAHFVVSGTGVNRSDGSATLRCHYLPYPTLAYQLFKSIIMAGENIPYLRCRAPNLFWNVFLCFATYGLPTDVLTLLAREEDDDAEQRVLQQCVEEMLGHAS